MCITRCPNVSSPATAKTVLLRRHRLCRRHHVFEKRGSCPHRRAHRSIIGPCPPSCAHRQAPPSVPTRFQPPSSPPVTQQHLCLRVFIFVRLPPNSLRSIPPQHLHSAIPLPCSGSRFIRAELSRKRVVSQTPMWKLFAPLVSPTATSPKSTSRVSPFVLGALCRPTSCYPRCSLTCPLAHPNMPDQPWLVMMAAPFHTTRCREARRGGMALCTRPRTPAWPAGCLKFLPEEFAHDHRHSTLPTGSAWASALDHPNISRSTTSATRRPAVHANAVSRRPHAETSHSRQAHRDGNAS